MSNGVNLNKFIENLQNKPRIVRIQILIGAVFISMVFITWVWVESLNLSSPGSINRAPTEASGESAFEQLKEVGEDAFKSLEEFRREFEREELVKQPEQEEVKPVRLPIEQ